MEVLGRVVSRIDENNIRVEIARTSACGGKCGECTASCGSKSYIIAKNYDGAKKDDIVRIESEDKKVLFLSGLVFIVPIAVIVFVYSFFGVFLKNEALRALISFLGGVFSFVAIILFFRFYKKLKAPVSRLYFSNEEKEYRN